MTGNQLYAIRKRLCFGKVEFGRKLGYTGKNETIKRAIHRAEGLHDKPLPLPIEERVRAMLASHKPSRRNDPEDDYADRAEWKARI